jgi:hypothetical protein
VVIPLWLNLELVANVAEVLLILESPVGTVWWHNSQVWDDGTWIGLKPNMVLITGLPSNVVEVTLSPWQTAQSLVIPLWLKAELVNNAPSRTVAVVILELAPMWQLSHPSAPIGMWLVAGALIVIAVVLYSAALVALWHWTQLVVVDWILAWIFVNVGIVE